MVLFLLTGQVLVTPVHPNPLPLSLSTPLTHVRC